MSKGPRITDNQLLMMAGIDPKTGLPTRVTEGCDLKAGMKRLVAVQDMQDAVNSIRWDFLPAGLHSQLVERILYYRGQAIMFARRYGEEIKFFFLPFALDGTIDIYGRYEAVRPVKFAAGKEEAFITGLTLKVIHDISDVDEIVRNGEDIFDYGVIFYDRTQEISQYVEPRYQLNQPVMDLESDILPFARTALMHGTGVSGMRVPTAGT